MASEMQPSPRPEVSVQQPEEEKKPSDWLFETVQALQLEWASDRQEEALVEGMNKPATALRIGQALIVRPELPDARDRASISGIRELVSRGSPTTAQSPDGVRWCQVAAVSAAGLATQSRHAGWHVVSTALRERDPAWVRGMLNPAIDRAQRYRPDARWNTVRFPDAVDEHVLDESIAEIFGDYEYPSFGISKNFERVEYNLEFIKSHSVQPAVQRLNDMSLTLLSLVNKLGDWVGSIEQRIDASLETGDESLERLEFYFDHSDDGSEFLVLAWGTKTVRIAVAEPPR